MRYTIKELTILRNIRTRSFKPDYMDERYGGLEDFFNAETDIFLEWLSKMESQGKIEYLLSTYEDTMKHLKEMAELEEIMKRKRRI